MIDLVEYDVILPIWEQFLWPGRIDIKNMSSMQYLSGYDVKIYDRYAPYFFAYYIDNNIAGINSAHKSSQTEFRSRGLYVFDEYRNQGIGKQLLEYTVKLGRSEGCDYCWSVPRKTALSTYLSAGFNQSSDFFETDTSDENCYAIIKL